MSIMAKNININLSRAYFDWGSSFSYVISS